MLKFIDALKIVRGTDAQIAEAVSVAAEHVLFQWHVHGNKTPHSQLMLAVNGGVDAAGLFGEKGATIKGISKALATVFAGVKLGKRDPQADIEKLTQEAVGRGFQTKAEAKDAAAKRKAEREAKAAPKVAETAPEPVVCALVLASGAAVKLTPEEAQQLLTTLEHLRAAGLSDVIDVPAEEVVDSLLISA